jgi:hypothetical protein
MRALSYTGVCVLATCALLSAPRRAAAQDGSTSASPNTQGPMTVERIKSGFLAAPDFRVTRFDRRTSEIAGGYAGWLTDRKLFVGGGAYWLANGNRDRELAYGGVVVGWLAHAIALSDLV